MVTAARVQPVSFEEFRGIARDGPKADLIDGVVHAAAPDNPMANELFVWLCGIMAAFARAQRLGKIFGARVAYRLDDSNGPVPDIGFVAEERRRRVKRDFIDGPPDLAAEIVTPESVQRDYFDKRRQYEAAGVREYWIVDPMQEKVTLLRLASATRKYRVGRSEKGALCSQVMTGFRLRPEWLWQDPLPPELDILSELLNSQH